MHPEIPTRSPTPATLNNRELQQAILDAHSMLLKTGAANNFQSTLQKHFVQLLAVQAVRAGILVADPEGFHFHEEQTE